MEILNFLNVNGVAITILITFLVFIWNAWRYLNLHIKTLKEKRFRIYHRLIKDLVQPDNPEEFIKLDRQIAVAYELRNFPEYYDVSVRILEGGKDSFAKDNRIQKEINSAIKYMRMASISRFLSKMRNNIFGSK